MRNIDSQFHKLKRKTVLRERTQLTDDHTNTLRTWIFESQNNQFQRLEEKLADTKELNDIYIEDSFELQNQLSGMQEEN